MIATSNSSNTQVKNISKNQIIRDLKQIGVNEGDHIGLGISFKSIGHVMGGPEVFIDALLEVVGSEGTIMIPTNTRAYHRSSMFSKKVYNVYDYRSTPSFTGLIPETLRVRKDSIRSKHPTNSVSAIGKYAKYLTETHNDKSRAFVPYSKLAEINGKILCIGIGDNLVSFRHEAQDLAGLLDFVPLSYVAKYKDENDEIKIFIMKNLGGCSKKLPGLVQIIRKDGLVNDGKIGMANSVLVPAKESLEIMTDLLKNNPSLNLCEDIKCLWCRELERRMHLFKEIDNPKIFQKSFIVISIIAIINWFRLRTKYL